MLIRTKSKIISKVKVAIAKKKMDILIMIFLGYITFISKIFFLQNYADNMFDFDSYTYLSTAILMTTGDASSSNPFIIFLSSLYPFFSDQSTAIVSLRVINLVFSVHLVLISYLIARKLFNYYFSFFTALIISFTPIFVMYSVNLHNDIPALAIGLTSLYFCTKERSIINFSTSTLLLILLAVIRLDVFAVFFIPYLIEILHYASTKIRKNFFLLLALVIPILAFLVFLFGQDYYYTITRFNPVEKLVLSLTVDNITNVWQNVIDLTGIDLWNKILVVIGLLGTVIFVMNNKDKIYTMIKNRRLEGGKSSKLLIYLVIIFFLSLLSIIVFHIPYTIDTNGKIIFTDNITIRYLIVNQILFIYGIIYSFLALTSSPSSVIGTLKTKIFKIAKNFFPYFFLSVFALLIINIMWFNAVELTEDKSVMMGSFIEATKWLSKNLENNEKAFLASQDVFFSIDPSLRDRSLDYKSLWERSGIIIKADTRDQEVEIVRQELRSFIRENEDVKYFVFDWVGKYSNKLLPYPKRCMELDNLLQQATNFDFILPHSKWYNQIVICMVRNR